MPMEYPVLDDRPINKWRVTELRDELKRRNLPTKGLKDDLVRRLNESICSEMLALEAQESRTPESAVIVAAYPSHGDVATPGNMENAVMDDHPTEIDKLKTTEGKLNVSDSVAQLNKHVIAKETMDSNHVTPSDSEVGVTQIATSEGCLESNKAEMVQEDKNSLGKDVLVVEKPGPDNNHVTPSEVEVSHISSSERVVKNDQIELENDVLKSPRKEDLYSPRENDVLNSSQKTDALFPMESSGAVSEGLRSQRAFSEKTIENMDNVDSKSSHMDAVVESKLSESSTEAGWMVNDSMITLEASSEKASEGNDLKPTNEELQPLQMDAECEVTYSKTQVYEVSPNLGSQVKSESISSDTVFIFEKNELKNNLNANSVHLEPEIVKAEMVQPPSSADPSNDGILHPSDDGTQHRKQGFVESNLDNYKEMDFRENNVNADNYSVDISVLEDVSKNETSNVVVESSAKIGSVDARPDLFPNKMETTGKEESGSIASATESKLEDEETLEKINIEQSSGDDSMEEDVLETRPSDSNHKSKAVDEKTELPLPTEKPSGKIHTEPGSSSEKLELVDKTHTRPEKRKMSGETTLENKELPKRQRKWSSDSLNVPAPQGSTLSAMSENLSEKIKKPNLVRCDSTISGDSPKERTVPPSPKPPTNSLRIDNFLRPFTLKAVQELLAKTGSVCSFWMDQIKTHCFVTYSSVEEAIATRNRVYNLVWPPNGGRLLVAEFVAPQEVKARLEGSSAALAVPVNPVQPPTGLPIKPPPFSHQQGGGKQAFPPDPIPEPPIESDRPRAPTKERLPPPPRMPIPEKMEPAIVTLDDLFKKTRATPRIYYLPLSEELVRMKLERQRQNRKC